MIVGLVKKMDINSAYGVVGCNYGFSGGEIT